MKRCVIVGGAKIADYAKIRQRLSGDDYYICCDSGLYHCARLGIEPDLIVGDFDSHPRPDSNAQIIVLPCEKDDTDTVFAAKEAVARGFERFLLVGVIGGRIDHTLGNLSLLLMLDTLGKAAAALDDYSEMQIVSDGTSYVDDGCKFFSLLNISGRASGITIKNAKYPLSDAQITCDYQYGISNEVLKGERAEISVKSGRLLLVKVFDE